MDIELPKDDFNGLTVDSVIQINEIKEIKKSELSNWIPRGIINQLQFAIVKDKLRQFMNDGGK